MEGSNGFSSNDWNGSREPHTPPPPPPSQRQHLAVPQITAPIPNLEAQRHGYRHQSNGIPDTYNNVGVSSGLLSPHSASPTSLHSTPLNPDYTPSHLSYSPQSLPEFGDRILQPVSSTFTSPYSPALQSFDGSDVGDFVDEGHPTWDQAESNTQQLQPWTLGLPLFAHSLYGNGAESPLSPFGTIQGIATRSLPHLPDTSGVQSDVLPQYPSTIPPNIEALGGNDESWQYGYNESNSETSSSKRQPTAGTRCVRFTCRIIANDSKDSQRPLLPSSFPPQEIGTCHSVAAPSTEAPSPSHVTGALQRRRWVCSKCPRKFHTLKASRRHYISKHTGYLPYRCPQCSNAFNRKDNCGRHMNDQHGTREGMIEDSLSHLLPFLYSDSPR